MKRNDLTTGTVYAMGSVGERQQAGGGADGAGGDGLSHLVNCYL